MASEAITRTDLTAILNEVLPSVAVDYIVEQGTSGIWTYRKWNSGIAECWYSAIIHPSMTTAYGSAYIANLGTYAFPSGLFTQVDNAFISLGMQGGVGGATYTSLSTTGLGTVYAYNFASYNATARDLPLSIYAKGTWK